MTDQEIIARFMEPNPRKTPNRSRDSVGGWWRLPLTNEWIPMPGSITLSGCHEVESRLTAGQRPLYHVMIIKYGPPDVPNYWSVLHADAEQRIKALAAILRPVVEGEATR